MSDQPEILQQWGIKSIPKRVIAEIADAAHDLKLTNGQMIERLWEHWKQGGAFQQPVNVMDDLVKLGNAFGPWGEANPPPLEVRRLINGYARMTRSGEPSRAQPIADTADAGRVRLGGVVAPLD